MKEFPLFALFIILGCLVLLSAFFSASETAMMAINRYRLRNQAESGHRGARLASDLLKTPDRLLGTILIGNNMCNIAASSIATLIGFELYGNAGIAIATGALLMLVLVFAEVAPKTLAAQYPEKIAFPAAYVLTGLFRLFMPLVWLVNLLSNGLLKLFGIKQQEEQNALNIDELKAAVQESSSSINRSYSDMLMGVLELDKITVNDVMVPANDIKAINFDDPWEQIAEEITSSRYTRMPVYATSMENVLGILHMRKVLPLLNSDQFTKETVKQLIRSPHFIPEKLSITKTLMDLKQQQRRFALVVDEYGSLQGLVTMEEILEEIVGDYTQLAVHDHVTPSKDQNSVLVNGNIYIRDINKKLNWKINTESTTINGLIFNHLEAIPNEQTCIKIDDYVFEIIQVAGTNIEEVKIRRLNGDYQNI